MSSVTFEGAVESALQREWQVRKRRYLKLAAWGAVAATALWYSAVQIKLSPVALIKGAGYMWDFITRLFPPDLSYLTVLGGATVETVQIAIWGTLLAIILSIPLSFLDRPIDLSRHATARASAPAAASASTARMAAQIARAIGSGSGAFPRVRATWTRTAVNSSNAPRRMRTTKGLFSARWRAVVTHHATRE